MTWRDAGVSSSGTHNVRGGVPLCAERFDEVLKFHDPGLAAVRCAGKAWHLRMDGAAAYARRFHRAFGFYEGLAAVVARDGSRHVRPDGTDLCAAVELGVFEALPAAAVEIARACGMDPARTRRLLRALAELRLATNEDGTSRATERGAFLAARHPWTLADAAVEYARYFPKMWEALPRALRLDSGWRSPDVFAEVAADPARVTPHHRMLTSYALHDYSAVPAALGLRGGERVIDAAGGLGTLAGLLVEVYPSLQVTVLDRPEVVVRAARGRQAGGRLHLDRLPRLLQAATVGASGRAKVSTRKALRSSGRARKAPRGIQVVVLVELFS